MKIETHSFEVRMGAKDPMIKLHSALEDALTPCWIEGRNYGTRGTGDYLLVRGTVEYVKEATADDS